MTNTEVTTSLLGAMARIKKDVDHAWLLKEEEGFVTAVWVDDDRLRVLVTAKDGTSAAMWAEHILLFF